jgi:hypothetical protein
MTDEVLKSRVTNNQRYDGCPHRKSATAITVGSDDQFYKPQQQEIYAACRQSGMKAQ